MTPPAMRRLFTHLSIAAVVLATSAVFDVPVFAQRRAPAPPPVIRPPRTSGGTGSSAAAEASRRAAEAQRQARQAEQRSRQRELARQRQAEQQQYLQQQQQAAARANAQGRAASASGAVRAPNGRIEYSNGLIKANRPPTAAELARGFTGKFTKSGLALVKVGGRILAVPPARVGRRAPATAVANQNASQAAANENQRPQPTRPNDAKKASLAAQVQRLATTTTAPSSRRAPARAAAGGSGPSGCPPKCPGNAAGANDNTPWGPPRPVQLTPEGHKKAIDDLLVARFGSANPTYVGALKSKNVTTALNVFLKNGLDPTRPEHFNQMREWLRGMDLSKPVQAVPLRKGERVFQYVQLPRKSEDEKVEPANDNVRPGNWFVRQGSKKGPQGIGISGAGRHLIEMEVLEDVTILVSTAEATVDSWTDQRDKVGPASVTTSVIGRSVDKKTLKVKETPETGVFVEGGREQLLLPLPGRPKDVEEPLTVLYMKPVR